MECYNGNYSESPAFSGRGYPAASDCAAPVDCAASQLQGLGAPAHLETAADVNAAQTHGAKIEYTCAGGKKMQAPEADPDGDEKVRQEFTIA